MFENRFIDRFSRTSPIIVPLLHLPAAALLMGYGLLSVGIAILPSLGLLFAGFLVWTLTEYWLHRTFFHWQPPGRFGERMHFLVHGVHHKWPRDRYRLVMPPAVSITMFWLFFGLFYLLLGDRVFPFHAGFAVGYVYYDLTHFYVHHYKPRTKWLKALRRHHLAHHAPRTPEDRKFGVSTTLWDHVFGTY